MKELKKQPVTISMRSKTKDLKFLDHISYEEAGQIVAFIGQWRERNKRFS